MDPRRFDTLVRTFAAAGTRRRVVAVLATLPLVGGLAGSGPDEAEAEKPRDRIKRRKDANRRKRRNRKHHHKQNNGKRNNGGGGGGKGGSETCTANGQACQQNSDCCQGNCFGQVCTNPPNQCGGAKCPDGAIGCCTVDGCCAAPANQCNTGGLCCAPNCGGKQCGPDGCGGSGTCGTCAPSQTCNLATAQCDGPTCTPAACPHGCCDENGVCQPGTAHDACGSRGEACFPCGPDQFCSPETGSCRDKPPCGPATCPNGCCFEQEPGVHVCRTDLRGCTPGGACCDGCCDGSVCQPGTDDGMCGRHGSACMVCSLLDPLCDQGRCQCDATNCPDGCCSGGPGEEGLCFTGCGTGGVQCKRDIGEQCSQDDDCCSGDCWRGVCSAFVSECEGVPCAAPSHGCCGAVCCDDLATCCGTGAACQANQCVCLGNACPGCCENGAGNPGRCLVNAAPHCGLGGVACAACDGCCDAAGACQENSPRTCPNAQGQCQACPDVDGQVCLAGACEACSTGCPCQGQNYCSQEPPTNTNCGQTGAPGLACLCMVRLDGTPFCAEGYHDAILNEGGCTGDADCQFEWGEDYVCVLAVGPNCPNTTPHACANPCANPGS